MHTASYVLRYAAAGDARPVGSSKLSEGNQMVSRTMVAEATFAGPRCRVLDPEDWDAKLASFRDASLEQSGSWNRLRWGNNRSLCLCVEQDGALLGGAVVIVLSVPHVRMGVGVLKFGPVWRHCESENIDNYKLVVATLRKELLERGLAMLVLPRATPLMLDLEVEALVELGFSCRPFEDSARYLADATLDEARQEESLSKRWRATLRRALTADLTFEVTDRPADIAKFSAIHDQLVARKNFASVEAESGLAHWLAAIPHQLTPRLFVARHHGEIVAGAVVLLGGDTAYYAYAATTENGRQLCASYALQWHILQRIRRDGMRWYDLGGHAHSDGLLHFKKGLVGKAGTVVEWPGEFFFAPSLRTRVMLGCFFAARDLRAWAASRA